MATYRKRGNRYQAQVRIQGHSPVSKSFRTKGEAKTWATEQEATINKGGLIDTTGRTVGDAIDRFQKERTTDTYQDTVLKWWAGQLGSRKLSTLRKADIIEGRRALQKVNNKRDEPIAAATVNRRMSLLSAVLTACTDEWFYIETNPARVPGLKEDIPKIEPLTDQQRADLIAACEVSDQPALLAFVLCAMASGARAGELQGLRWEDVDLDKGVARLYDTKNGDTRVAPIQGNALAALRKYQRDYPTIGNSFIFRNHTGTFPFNYRQSWGRAKTVSGVEIRFHDLRHDAASNLAMAGASLREIGEVLGHRSMQMVKRYSHFVDDHIAELGKRISTRIDK